MMLLAVIIPLLIVGLLALVVGLLCDRYFFRARVKSRLRARVCGLALGALLFSIFWVLLTQGLADRAPPSGIVTGIAYVTILSMAIACLLNSMSLWRFWKARNMLSEQDIFG